MRKKVDPDQLSKDKIDGNNMESGPLKLLLLNKDIITGINQIKGNL